MTSLSVIRMAADMLDIFNGLLDTNGFAVRQEGVEGDVTLFDTDEEDGYTGIRVLFEDGKFGMVVNY